MYRFAAGFLVFSLAAFAAESAAPLWSFAHPNAAALIGIDVRTIRESQAGQKIAAEVQKSAPAALSFPGMALLNDIDKVLISSPGEKAAPKATAATKGAPPKKNNPPFLVVLSGHFPPDHLKEIMTGTRRLYQGTAIYSPPQGGEPSIALVSDQTILLGDAVSVQSAIARKALPAGAATPLMTRAAALSAANDFWIVANASPADFQAQAAQLGDFATAIRGIEAGMALHDGFNLEVTVNTKDEATARQISALLTAQFQSALQGKVDDQQALEFFKKLNIVAEGPRVGMRIALTQEEFDQQIAAAERARAAGPAPKPQPAAAPKRTAPVSDHPGVIRIYGLDGGGVRDIPEK